MADSIVIQSPPQQDDPAHVQAMIDKVDGKEPPANDQQQENQQQDDQRPEWLPEKFKSPEDLAKAYAELEAKQGAGKQDESQQENQQQEQQQSQEDAKQAVENAGLNFDEFSTEFAQKGELSTESYAKLEKAGIPKALVDSYIQGQKALAEGYESDIKSAIGGAEKWDQVAEWATQNLSKEELIAFNKVIDSRDPAAAKLAVQGLAAKFDAANPTEGNLLSGRFNNAVGDRYESLAQMQADMSKPEYKNDPAFREKVKQKIARSELF